MTDSERPGRGETHFAVVSPAKIPLISSSLPQSLGMSCAKEAAAIRIYEDMQFVISEDVHVGGYFWPLFLMTFIGRN